MADAPIETVLEFQRRTLEGSQRAIEQHIEFQKRLGEVLTTGLSESAAARERTAAATQRALERYLDAIAAMVPGAESGVEQIQEAMDEQFDAMSDASDDVQTFAEDSVAEYERTSEAYLEGVSDQLDLVTEAHAEFEANTLEFLEETEAQLADLADEADDEVADRIEAIQDRARALRAEFED